LTTDVLALRKHNTNQGQAICLAFFYGCSPKLASGRQHQQWHQHTAYLAKQL